MAQHDYVISNGTGAAVRSDLNNALLAIVSQNSGATEPTTTYAYQWWADTTTGLLKIRNSANNAWITLRELDGTLTIEDGTVSAPGLAFRDDLNTGIWRPGTDQFAISTNGVERVEWGTSEVVFNDGGTNYDFRVEGDNNANLLFVDASADAVGIGTSSPSGYIHIQGTSTGTETYGRFTTGSASGDQSLVIKSGSTRDHMAIQVSTNAGVADDLALQPDGGRVGIGTTSPGSELVVTKSSGNVRLTVQGGTNGDGTLALAGAGTGIGKIAAWDQLVFGKSSGGAGDVVTEWGRWDTSGRFLVGTSTSRIVEDLLGNGPQGLIQIEATNSDAIMSIISAGTSDAGRAGTLSLGRHRNSTVGGTPTIVQNGDTLGAICFAGGDGTDMRTKGASIAAQVDGTPGVDDMPGRLVFSTTADGASSPTERLRIANNGAWGLAGANYGSSGQVLTSNGSGSAPTWQAVGGVGTLRAWISFDGSSASIGTGRGSGNVSSVTDNGAGDYTVNFTTAMPDANYCCNVTGGDTPTINRIGHVYSGTRATGSIRVAIVNISAGLTDSNDVNVSIFR